MPVARKFQLGSEREEAPRGDRLLGLQRLQEKNRACEHVVVVGDGLGAATLAVKMRGQDVCPHCTRREAAYWRERGKTAEGVAASLRDALEDLILECAAGSCDGSDTMCGVCASIRVARTLLGPQQPSRGSP